MNHVPAPTTMSVPRRRVRRSRKLSALAVSIAAGVGLVAAPIVLSPRRRRARPAHDGDHAVAAQYTFQVPS